MNVEWVWHELVGMAGVVIVLIAYFGLQSGRLRGDGIVFQLANIFGAGGIAVSLVYDFNLSAMTIELAWIAISIYGLVRGMRARAAAKAAQVA
ncbi:MAG: CBU_0592 family membrane protein [Arenimonas sp.]